MELDLVRISRDSELPIADQLFHQILRGVLDERLKPGEKLPPERELAEQLGISRGTVKRAYGRLAQAGAIDMRQGSGSYVRRNAHALERNQKKEAAGIIRTTFRRLRDMGLSDQEILSLAGLHALESAPRQGLRKCAVMVVSNNHDILSELEQQFSYLQASSPLLISLSFLTLDTIAGNPDPVQMLLGYQLIVATSIDYPAVAELVPMFENKMLEARLSPRTKTLVELSSLPTDSRVSVVYRTPVFREMVVDCLLSMGFRQSRIHCREEKGFDPPSYDEGGVGAVINFNESPVYLDPAHRQRARAFEEKGGRIIRFEYQIERGSLVRIEDQIQRLLLKEEQ